MGTKAGELNEKLEALIIFRGLLKYGIISEAAAIIRNMADDIKDKTSIYDLIHKLMNSAEENRITGNIYKNIIYEEVLHCENRFSLAVEKNMKLSDAFVKNVKREISILTELSEFNIFEEAGIDEFQIELICGNDLPEEEILKAGETEKIYDRLTKYYSAKGVGIFSKFEAFRWDTEAGLIGIENYDPVKYKNIIGYDYQKETILKNTTALINGHPANNVLLSGARGTGKSSLVKAMLGEFGNKKLRMIELDKRHLGDIAEILELVSGRGYYFIIFLDDLSFEDNEIEYKHLKSVLEGGLEIKPGNVLIYATSNRRHIIKETWSERQTPLNDVHENDSINEKISLSDRFGITLQFMSTNQDEYLNIVYDMAERGGIKMTRDELKREAVKWSMANNAKSGRTARQFVNSLE